MPNSTAWKSDNYKFVGKAFKYAYDNRLNKLTGSILSEINIKSIDYELRGSGGYGELQKYDGNNVNWAHEERGFSTIIVPDEFEKSDFVGYKQAKIDKSGECARIGQKLGDSAAMTVYMHAIRVLGNAWNPDYVGGDGKPWAAADHPNASKGSVGRKYIVDPESGTFSNSVNYALSVANIGKIEAMAADYVTPDGLPYLSELNLLLVSPALAQEASKICGDNGKLRPTRNPDDNSNAANPVSDLQYMVIGGGKAGFTGKQWALCDRTRMKEIFKLAYITRPTVKNYDLDNPWKDAYSAYADFGIGWGDARPIIFSDPG